jgi:hypothetical protein
VQVDKKIKVGDLVRQNHTAHRRAQPVSSLAIVTDISTDGNYIKMVWQDTLEKDGCHISRVERVGKGNK